MKVNINGHSHQVEVETEAGELAEVIAAAEGLWQRTAQPTKGPAGPAYGFTGEVRGTGGLYGMDADGALPGPQWRR